jgi:Tfp pilus assembly protein PilN
VININLLPSAQRPTLVIFDRTLAIGLTLIAIELLALIGFALYENNVITQLNNQYADISQKVLVEQQAVKEVDDLRDQAVQLQAKAELLERIKESPVQLAEVLVDLRNQTPRNLWFTTVTISHSTSGGSVGLQGKTSTFRDVADLMLNLDGSQVFGDSSLTSAARTLQQGHITPGDIGFNITGILSPAVVGQQ